MNRMLWLLLGGFALAAGTAAGSTGVPSIDAQRPPDDTVYVAEADPVVVVYKAQLDTLVVRAEDETGTSIATAGPETQEPAVDSDVSAETVARREENSPNSGPDTTTAEPQTGPSTRTRSTASSPDASSGVKKGISVAGLVIDRTHSVIGRDFQNAFHNYWEEPDDISNFTIRIVERPLPQFGSQIRVSVGETAVFRAQLRPGYRRIEQAAQQAAARTQYYLQEFYEPREVY